MTSSLSISYDLNQTPRGDGPVVISTWGLSSTMIDGMRIAMLVEEGFEDSELVGPLRAMKDAGVRVVVVGSGTQKLYRGKRGQAAIAVDVDADHADIACFDGVIVPGGQAPERMRLYQPMIALVRDIHSRGKLVAAICHGPQLLISAGIVRGRRVTSRPSIAVELQNAGALWVDAPLVKDDNIITSRKPADLPRFNKAIIDALKAQVVACPAVGNVT